MKSTRRRGSPTDNVEGKKKKSSSYLNLNQGLFVGDWSGSGLRFRLDLGRVKKDAGTVWIREERMLKIERRPPSRSNREGNFYAEMSKIPR